MPSTQLNPHTIIVGGGYAGLACAIKLAKAGHKITIIEATAKLGGRARSITIADQQLDNGQHLLIGAYSATLELLADLNLVEQTILKRRALNLVIKASSRIALKLPKLSAPLHTFIGLLTSKFSWYNKWLIAKLFYKLYQIGFKISIDQPVLNILQSWQQSPQLIHDFWEPLVLAIMSTPISQASAKIFFNVLRATFTGKRCYSDWLIPTTDLDQLLVKPALQYLSKYNCKIVFDVAITEILVAQHLCIGVASTSQQWLADQIVLAIPAWYSCKLLKPIAATNMLATQLSQISYIPITTIYLIFATEVALPDPIIGTTSTPVQWFISRETSKQANIISGIITGALDPNLNEATIIAQTITQLSKIVTQLPELLIAKLCYAGKAAFLCTPTIEQLRPNNATNIANLWLAGDHIATGYPATIESAIISGIQAAKQILDITRI